MDRIEAIPVEEAGQALRGEERGLDQQRAGLAVRLGLEL